MRKIPKKLLPYYEQLSSNFLSNVKVRDERGFVLEHQGRRYYWRWMSTIGVAFALNVTPAAARYNLTKLEKLGFVDSWRESNCVRWSIKTIEGFKNFEFKDYLIRI